MLLIGSLVFVFLFFATLRNVFLDSVYQEYLNGGEDFSSLSSTSFVSLSNNAVYISTIGTNDMKCGNTWESACLTVSYGFQRVGGFGELLVHVGTYTEATGIAVSGTVSIMGQSRKECYLSKRNNDNSFVLFSLDNSGGNLTLTNLTIRLSNHSHTACLISSSKSVAVSITICMCDITMEEGLSEIYGQSFYINNNKSAFKLEGCTVYGIITNCNYPFICSSTGLSNLCIANSSFVNVQNSGVSGGCFFISNVTNFTCDSSLFVMCRCDTTGISLGGVGIMKHVSTGSLIQTCVFLNCTATSGGALSIQSCDLTVTNSTFVFCVAASSSTSTSTSVLTQTAASPSGGALFIYSLCNQYNNYNCVVTRCSFENCSALSCGGAVCVSCVEVMLSYCTFWVCKAEFGGALFAGSEGNEREDVSWVSVVDYNVFIGNTAYSGKGLDVYVNTNAHMNIVNSYTNVTVATSVVCENSDCTGAMNLGPSYDSSTCSSMFSATGSIVGECFMPCASLFSYASASKQETRVCVKPDACPPGYSALVGGCVPSCAFWAPSSSSSPSPSPSTVPETNTDGINETGGYDGGCTALCEPYDGWGHRLCRALPRSCAMRVPVVDNTVSEAVPFPCGSAECYWDKGSMSDGGSMSGVGRCMAATESCSNSDHYEKNTTSFMCQLRPCSERRKNRNNKFLPCGSTDCYWDKGDTANTAKCIGTTTECTNPSHYTKEGAGMENHTCVLKGCVERTAVFGGSGTVYLCGSSDCVYDVNFANGSNIGASMEAEEKAAGTEREEAEGQCRPECAFPADFRESAEGVCVRRGCADLAGHTAVCKQRSDCHARSDGGCEDRSTYTQRIVVGVSVGVGVPIIIVVTVVVVVAVSAGVGCYLHKRRMNRYKKVDVEEEEGNEMMRGEEQGVELTSVPVTEGERLAWEETEAKAKVEMEAESETEAGGICVIGVDVGEATERGREIKESVESESTVTQSPVHLVPHRTIGKITLSPIRLSIRHVLLVEEREGEAVTGEGKESETSNIGVE